MKILIAENDFVCQRLLQKLLTPYGEVHIAMNGKEAIEAYRLAMKENRPYDLVCLDIIMPEMDGHTVLKKIRNRKGEKGSAKIIMTTALADPKNVVTAMREHCDGYLIKPIAKETLISKIRSLGLL